MANVEQILDQAVAEGYLTPLAATEGPAHSAGFLGFLDLVTPWDVPDGAIAVDLGTGGGVPGLVLSTLTPWRWVLVDRGQRRVTFLQWAVRQLGLEDRVEVRLADAVDAGRGVLRGTASLVTARSFAAPGPTVECAGPLLVEQGVLVVSEPPDGMGCRWPADGLAAVGLRDLGGWTIDDRPGSPGYRAMVRSATCPDRFPRRFSRQVADPLF